MQALQWALKAGIFQSRFGRCPADRYLIMLATMPVFKGTPRETPCAHAFIEKATGLINTSRDFAASAVRNNTRLEYALDDFQRTRPTAPPLSHAVAAPSSLDGVHL